MLPERVLIIGLDCGTPQLIFDRFRDQLPNIRQVIDGGVHGELTSVIPAITVPAWACSMASLDPGQLGIYGFRNRKDYSYDGLSITNSSSVKAELAWEMLSRMGKHLIMVAVPPGYPPKPINGVSVSCFLTPTTTQHQFTYPATLGAEIRGLVGDYKVDVENFRTDDKSNILTQITEMTEKRFAVFDHLLSTRPWDLAMMVEIGVDRMHHGFWKYMDPAHPKHEPGNPYQDAILNYYRMVDEKVGRILRHADDKTAVIIMSDHGAKPMVGGICVNEWLQRKGYLALAEQPAAPTPFGRAKVDWTKTAVWGEGGYYARIFMNVQGREPSGVIPPGEYESFRDRLAAELEGIRDEQGNDIGTKVYKPEAIYQQVNNIAPDLIVYFGDLYWRSVGSVGMNTVYTYENDTGPDDANHAQQGIFIAAGPGIPSGQRLEGLSLLDTGPTVLSLFGVAAPAHMRGKVVLPHG